MGIYELLPYNGFWYWTDHNVCANKFTQFICRDLVFFVCGFDQDQLSEVSQTHQMDLHYIHYLNTLNEASIRPNLSFTHLLDLIHCIMHRIKPHLSCSLSSFTRVGEWLKRILQTPTAHTLHFTIFVEILYCDFGECSLLWRQVLHQLYHFEKVYSMGGEGARKVAQIVLTIYFNVSS